MSDTCQCLKKKKEIKTTRSSLLSRKQNPNSKLKQLVWPHLLSSRRSRQREPRFPQKAHSEFVKNKAVFYFIYIFFCLPPLGLIFKLHFMDSEIKKKRRKKKTHSKIKIDRRQVQRLNKLKSSTIIASQHGASVRAADKCCFFKFFSLSLFTHHIVCLHWLDLGRCIKLSTSM